VSSLVERDYIMRLVKQLAALLAAVLKLKQEKKYDQALEQLQGAFPGFFGIEYRTLTAIDSASAGQLLGEAAKIKILARLIEEEAVVYHSRGDELRCAARQVHALELYIEAALRDPRDGGIASAMEALLKQVEPEDLGEKYQVWLQSQSHSTAG